MESQQRPKNLTPSLLWGDLAARATSGGCAYDGFSCHIQELIWAGV
jgi:hypothetical protein